MVMGHISIDRKGLKQFLMKVNAAFPLQKAILFGSRARGDELMDSDYDLLLVSDAFEPLDWRERITEVLRCWDLNTGLEVLCYTSKEFARKVMEIGIVAEAVREGKDLPLSD